MRMRFLAVPVALIVLGHGCAEQSDGAIAEPQVDGKGGGKASAGSSGSGGSTMLGKGGTSSGKGGNTGSSGSGATGGNAGEGGEPQSQGGETGSGGEVGGGGAPGSGDGGSGAVIGAGGGCHNPAAPIAGISARYSNEASGDGTSIGSQLYVFNVGPNTIDLADIVLRYYFTNEVTANISVGPNWAYFRPNPPAGGQDSAEISNITITYHEMDDCSVAGADAYFEFTFKQGMGTVAPGNHLIFSWDATNGSGQTFIQSNDYSYSASQPSDMDYDKIVILNASGVVWGNEP